MKKAVSLILAALMLFSVLPVFASAQVLTGEWGDNIVWTFDEASGTLTLSGSGEMKHADFEDNIPPWREFGRSLKKVIIEEGITSVGDFVFYECKKIEEVSLPEEIEYIGVAAFSSTGNLKHITLPSTLKTIYDEAFMGSGLTELVIPEGVTHVETNAFLYCYFLESAVISSSVMTFPQYTFTNDFRLKELINNSRYAFTYPCLDYYYGPIGEIIADVESAHNRLYADEDIAALSYAPAVEKFNALYGTDFSLDEAGFEEMFTYIDETIPFEDYCGEGVPPYLTISCLADSEQHKLCRERGAAHRLLDSEYDCLCGTHGERECEDVAPTDTHNGYKGGKVCPECHEMLEAPEIIPALGRTDGDTDDDYRCGDSVYRHFDEETGTITIYGTGAMYDEPPRDFYEPDVRLDKFTSVVVEEGVTGICESFCAHYTWLESVSLPSTLEAIADCAFAYSGVKEIAFPANLKSIGEDAFMCSALEKAVLPEGLLTVGKDAFTFSFFLKDIDIPSTVTEIGEGAFHTTVVPTLINRSSAVVSYDTCEEQYIFSDEKIEDAFYALYWAALKDTLAKDLPAEMVAHDLYEEEYARCVSAMQEALGYEFEQTSEFLPQVADDLLMRMYEEGKVTAACNTDGDEVYPATLFFCYAGSPQQAECEEHHIPYKLIGQDFDCERGLHNVYENDYIAPDCTHNGYSGGKVCLECEAVLEAPVIVPATGHTPVADAAVAPSCTAPGKTEGSHCPVCGEILTAQKEVPATGHTDADQDGKCDVCGEMTDAPVIEMNIVQRMMAAIRSLVDSIISLFRRLFG